MSPTYPLSLSDLLMLKEKIERQLASIAEVLAIQSQNPVLEGDQITLTTLKKRVTKVSSQDIEGIILAMTGHFMVVDVFNQIHTTFPGLIVYDKTVVANLLHKLVVASQLKYVRHRTGRAGAIYAIVYS